MVFMVKLAIVQYLASSLKMGPITESTQAVCDDFKESQRVLSEVQVYAKAKELIFQRKEIFEDYEYWPSLPSPAQEKAARAATSWTG